MSQISEREIRLRRRCRDDFKYFAPRCLKIVLKEAIAGPDGRAITVAPFVLNHAQQYIHERLEKQRNETGRVRALILKGRQQGASTYVEGRYYWKVIHRKGVKAFILTHAQAATDNLFTMVERYHQNNNPLLKPHVGKSNAKELEFDLLDSRYSVATAGSKGAGRSQTVHYFHGSEVAFWENADDHAAGALQAVPDVPDTEVILESTANGIGNFFHRKWQDAEAGLGDYIAIFVPWYWQPEYAKPAPESFELSHSPEDVPPNELTEAQYAKAYRLTDAQMYWRRQKIVELGYWKFKQEYPATASEAFETSGENSFVPLVDIVKARKAKNVTSDGPLLIGVDPSGGGGTGDRFALIRRRTRRAFDMQTWTKLKSMQQVALLHRIIQSERPSRMFIDIGYNPAVHDRLKELPGTDCVVGVNFGEGSLEPERYKNKRAEMWDKMKEWLADEGGASIPDSDELQADILAPKENTGYTWSSNSQLVLESKHKMKARGIRSPDTADALALTFALPVARSKQTTTAASTNFDVFSDNHSGMIVADTNFDV